MPFSIETRSCSPVDARTAACCRGIASRTDGGEVSDRAQELTRQGDRSASHAAASTSGRDQAASVAAAVGLDQPGPAPLEARRPRSSLVSPYNIHILQQFCTHFASTLLLLQTGSQVHQAANVQQPEGTSRAGAA